VIKIFYVHGWGSKFDPTSDKVQALSELGEVHGITVTWADGHQRVFDQLTEEISAYQPDLLVGTSMGGYGVSHLGTELGIPFVAINPAIRPHETLMDRVGTGTDYYGREYELTWQTVSAFPEFAVGGYGLVLVAMDDDVINAQETINRYAEHYDCRVYETGGHRFTNLTEAIVEIRTFYNIAEEVYGLADI
jgi:predicted esterase YcpF (UPF0227 family)